LRSQEDLQKFLRLIVPHVPVVSMLKKVMLLYSDPDFQQRWISEVAQTTAWDGAILTSVVEEQKRKLARFRE
jgi:hypothetical protein